MSRGPGFADLEQKTLQPLDNLPARGCHPCVKHVLLSMCPGRTLARWSEWRDSNPRPLVPQTSALTGLRYTPMMVYIEKATLRRNASSGEAASTSKRRRCNVVTGCAPRSTIRGRLAPTSAARWQGCPRTARAQPRLRAAGQDPRPLDLEPRAAPRLPPRRHRPQLPGGTPAEGAPG
jgi:hypothetical protein